MEILKLTRVAQVCCCLSCLLFCCFFLSPLPISPHLYPCHVRVLAFVCTRVFVQEVIWGWIKCNEVKSGLTEPQKSKKCITAKLYLISVVGLVWHGFVDQNSHFIFQINILCTCCSTISLSVLQVTVISSSRGHEEAFCQTSVISFNTDRTEAAGNWTNDLLAV